MEERKNNFSVEKRIKEKLKNDRARTQVGRISSFGLLEMSRQRLRPGMIETTTQACIFCHGTGITRSDDSLALAILRELEEEGLRKKGKTLIVNAPVDVSNYMLNEKREHIALIEKRYEFRIKIQGDISLQSPNFNVLEHDEDKNRNNVISKKNNINKKNDSTSKPSEIDTKIKEEENLSTKDEMLNKRKRKRKRKKITKNEEISNINFENKDNEIEKKDNDKTSFNNKLKNSKNKKTDLKKNDKEINNEEITKNKNKIVKKIKNKTNDKKSISKVKNKNLENESNKDDMIINQSIKMNSEEIDKISVEDLKTKEVKKGWWSKKND